MTPPGPDTLHRRIALFRAAENLARAADQLRVLQQCEKATGGGVFATDADYAAVVHASRQWSVVRGSRVWGSMRGARRVAAATAVRSGARRIDWPVDLDEEL